MPGSKSKATVPPEEGEQTLINYNEESGMSLSQVSAKAYIHITPPVLWLNLVLVISFIMFPLVLVLSKIKPIFLPLSISGEWCSAWTG